MPDPVLWGRKYALYEPGPRGLSDLGPRGHQRWGLSWPHRSQAGGVWSDAGQWPDVQLGHEHRSAWPRLSVSSSAVGVRGLAPQSPQC